MTTEPRFNLRFDTEDRILQRDRERLVQAFSITAASMPFVLQALRETARQEHERARARAEDLAVKRYVALEAEVDDHLWKLRERMGLGGPEVLLDPVKRAKLALIKELK